MANVHEKSPPPLKACGTSASFMAIQGAHSGWQDYGSLGSCGTAGRASGAVLCGAQASSTAAHKGAGSTSQRKLSSLLHIYCPGAATQAHQKKMTFIARTSVQEVVQLGSCIGAAGGRCVAVVWDAGGFEQLLPCPVTHGCTETCIRRHIRLKSELVKHMSQGRRTDSIESCAPSLPRKAWL